jgi:anaerobic magnesium-protoporphyrin IX monomethyl ester cyclase
MKVTIVIKKIDLLLVNPGNRIEQFARLSDLATVAQPLGVAILASIAREKGVSVEIFDAEAEFMTPDQAVEAIVDRYDPLIIGLTAFTTKMTAAGMILKGVKEQMPNVVKVIGGHHPSAIPKETILDEVVDFVVAGEGFDPIIQLVDKIKRNNNDFKIEGLWYKGKDGVVGHGLASGPKDLDKLPYAAWDLLPMDKYKAHHWQAWDYDLDQSKYALIYTSLGCPFRCEFCSVNVVYGTRGTRFRSAKHVVGEIKLLVEKYGIRHIEIVDDLFTANKSRVNQFCDEMIANKLGDKVNMWCFGRTDTVEKNLVKKMKRAGINWIFMGIESGDDNILATVAKKQTLDKIRMANDILKSTGIHVGGNYVFGLGSDTIETMQKTSDLAMELNTEYANFFLAMAYPGTSLYEDAIKKGYELPEKWGQYGFFAPDALPLRNDNVTATEILDFRDKAFEDYFSSSRYQSLVKRKFGSHIKNFINDRILSKKIMRNHRV